nr:MAG TPA: hypothetical protein [Caudoviricetes sp.]
MAKNRSPPPRMGHLLFLFPPVCGGFGNRRRCGDAVMLWDCPPHDLPVQLRHTVPTSSHHRYSFQAAVWQPPQSGDAVMPWTHISTVSGAAPERPSMPSCRQSKRIGTRYQITATATTGG